MSKVVRVAKTRQRSHPSTAILFGKKKCTIASEILESHPKEPINYEKNMLEVVLVSALFISLLFLLLI